MKSVKFLLMAMLALLSINVSSAHNSNAANNTPSQLKPIIYGYFEIKDALVKSDSKTAAAKSKDLLVAIAAVKMETLTESEHNVWMKVMQDLNRDAKTISETQDIKKQRQALKALSQNTYTLLKASQTESPVYYNHCPMVDANWLSRESGIKNPYYGSQMLTCGKTVETIK